MRCERELRTWGQKLQGDPGTLLPPATRNLGESLEQYADAWREETTRQARQLDLLRKRFAFYVQYNEVVPEQESLAAEAAKVGFHTKDADLTELLNLTAFSLSGQANMDTGIAWLDVLERIEARLLACDEHAKYTE